VIFCFLVYCIGLLPAGLFWVDSNPHTNEIKRKFHSHVLTPFVVILWPLMVVYYAIKLTCEGVRGFFSALLAYVDLRRSEAAAITDEEILRRARELVGSDDAFGSVQDVVDESRGRRS